MRAILLPVVIAISLPLLPAAPVPKDGVTEEFDWKGEQRTRVVRTLVLGGEKVEFVRVPKGEFLMGSPESEKHEITTDKPQYKVTFTKPLWVGKYPVTKGQFAAFVKAVGYRTESDKDDLGGRGFDGRFFKTDIKYDWRETGWEQTDRHPVVNVGWKDAEAYTAWASKESKKVVRLLSEVEFEYANRGGTTTQFFTGDDEASLEGYANVADMSAKAKWDVGFWAKFDDGEPFTSPVGKYKPNPFGLHDTTGNAGSWCADWSDSRLHARRKNGVTDPKPNADGERRYRAVRGGSWRNSPAWAYSALSAGVEPQSRDVSIGFRVCAELE